MTNDKKGYYKILGISISASNDEIRKAFKEKAHEMHPDKNKDRDTTKDFQFLNEAYNTLINPLLRATYDTSNIVVEENNSNSPIKCFFCNKVTAQPRYVVFYEVKSFILLTTSNTTQGIFCPDCAEKKVIKPTIITWLLGWWGFPFGILFSLYALGINLIGGKKPKDINYNILSYQAWYFAQQNKLDIANSIIDDALTFATSQKQKDEVNNFKKTIYKYNGEKDFKKLKNKWKFFSKSFFIQFIAILFVLASITIFTLFSVYTNQKEAKLKKIQANYEIKINNEIERVYNLNHPIKQLPTNGEVFEKNNYTKILAPFKIVTSGSGHHFVKIEDYDTGVTKLKIFVRKGETVETKLPLGKYKMKYAVGDNWYGEKDLFGKDTIYSKSDDVMLFEHRGNEIIGHTVELFLQKNGNLITKEISANEF